MNKQAQIAGGAVAIVALLGLAFFLLRPSTSAPVPEPERVKPPVEKLRDAPAPVAMPTPTKPAQREPAPVLVAADHPFLKIPAYEVPDIKDSIKDPLGVLPITQEAMVQSMDEMQGDIDECVEKHLADADRRPMSIDFHINAEIAPEAYGPPDPKARYGIVRGAKVMDREGDYGEFEKCMTRALEDILYDKPEGDGVRVNWQYDFTK
ncbi:MAG: hypothetical protein KC656_09715 [Myxococcales bacterium]|nr:hypothetical protein [Myxococcales bacterium]MCB9670199.1 hypothetical protein [Alphaproteobacteria bacterium]MCB9694701.1 hypothetical protein [Alphaproteobacteria bacterium]